jgi:hypothetical protein
VLEKILFIGAILKIKIEREYFIDVWITLPIGELLPY